jgi:hypothetical protein
MPDLPPPAARRRIVLRFPLDPGSLSELSGQSVFIDAKRLGSAELGELSVLPGLESLELARAEADFSPLAACLTLRWLTLTDPASLDGVERLQQLTGLSLYHLPRLHAVDALRELRGLTSLRLSTPPSYDASRKYHHVRSLEPLAHLAKLQKLVLRGIMPDVDRLRPLEALRGLQTLEVTHVFAFDITDYTRLARALPNTSGHCLVPFFEATWAGRCPRCGANRVALTAPPPRTARTLCPACQRQRLEAHVTRWNAAAA